MCHSCSWLAIADTIDTSDGLQPGSIWVDHCKWTADAVGRFHFHRRSLRPRNVDKGAHLLNLSEAFVDSVGAAGRGTRRSGRVPGCCCDAFGCFERQRCSIAWTGRSDAPAERSQTDCWFLAGFE